MSDYDAKQTKNYVPRTVKLEKVTNDRLEKVCQLNNTQVSKFMREAILEKLNSGAVSNVAGQNIIHYDSSKDTFTWTVKLDDGKEIEVLQNLSSEFIQDLSNNMQFELNKRDELLKKKQKNSVAIPKSLTRG